jgi:choline dehydrogenase-like flavoprotein
MDHVLVGIGGPSSDAPRVDADSQSQDSGGATGFYIPQAVPGGPSGGRFRRGYAMQGGIGRGPSWYLMAHGEMLPRRENRITTDAGKRDAWGIPVAHIEVSWSANELAMIEHASAALHQVAAAAGLAVRVPPSGKAIDALAFNMFKGKLQGRSGAFLPGSAIHELGGAAMGDAPESSVVDSWGRCWDVSNVFVTDGACFPGGCSQNVTLTIMALAVRASSRIVNDWRADRL